MTVYRVENAQGEGMYRNRTFSDRDCPLNQCYDSYRHPMPSNDSELMRSLTKAGIVGNRSCWRNYAQWTDFHFGFSNIAQLKNWLYTDEIRARLAWAGFMINEYDCETEYHGDTQAVFIRDTARIIDTLNLETI